MTKQEKQNKKPVDGFQTVAMMQSIKEMKDEEKKKDITNIIEYISSKKCIPRTNRAECIFEIIGTCCHFLRLTHQYQLPTEIWMKIAAFTTWLKRRKDGFISNSIGILVGGDLEDVTENRKESSRQARRHEKAKEGDESVIARSETCMNTKPHENYMTKLQDGEKKQKIEDVLNNISKITFTPRGDSRGGKKSFKQFEEVWSKAVKMEKTIQGFFKLNLLKEDLNKAYAEWMEIARTLEKDMGRPDGPNRKRI
eukprot:jgi/Psemu1/30344/gm1.30344_g